MMMIIGFLLPAPAYLPGSPLIVHHQSNSGWLRNEESCLQEAATMSWLK